MIHATSSDRALELGGETFTEAVRSGVLVQFATATECYVMRLASSKWP